MNKRCVVVMSAYNGSNYLEKQLDSIFAQKNVNVSCIVRDDGSTDDTLTILENYSKKNNQLIIMSGKNVGWKESFMIALSNAPEAEFYAFSDQDDIWLDNKIERALSMLETLNNNTPNLYHSDRISCDEKLSPIKGKLKRVTKPKDFYNALVQEFCQGCTAVFNKKTKNLACHAYSPELPHDLWVALIAYTFGTIVYDNTPTLYHIHHQKNASTDGYLLASWKKRLSSIKEHKTYQIPSNILLLHYNEKLTLEQKRILQLYNNYQLGLKNRLKLFFNPKVRRINLAGTIFLKISILLKKIAII